MEKQNGRVFSFAHLASVDKNLTNSVLLFQFNFPYR